MDIKHIKQLVKLVEEANISHLSLEVGDDKIKIKKELSVAPTSVVIPQAGPVATPAPVATSATTSEAPAPADDPNLVPIKSQMVGTFYSSPNPESAPYVKVGDSIKINQVICIIEAMKLFNEIESDISGKIEKICVDNGTPVEFGQDLFLVRVG